MAVNWRRRRKVVVEMDGQRYTLYAGDTMDVSIRTVINETQNGSSLIGDLTSKAKVRIISVG